MKKMLEKEVKFTIRGLLIKTISTVLIVFGLISVFSPATITELREKWNQKEATVEVEETETKEVLKVYKCDGNYVILYTDDSYYCAGTLDEAATVLTDATGRAFAAANSNLYEVAGGKLEVVKVDVYR